MKDTRKTIYTYLSISSSAVVPTTIIIAIRLAVSSRFYSVRSRFDSESVSIY